MPGVRPDAGTFAGVTVHRTIGAGGAVGAAVIYVLATCDGAVAQTSAPSACQMRLTPDRAAFRALGDTSLPGGCGGPDVVLLERIVAVDGSVVAVEPPATLRCEMAEAIVHFVRQDLVPSGAAMGSLVSAIENFDSYDCRGRNRVAGAQLSEHGRANALDIRSVRLRDGRVVRPAAAAAPVAFRRAMKDAVCSRFTTVLGPGSDGYHEDHIHVDLAQRRGGYRLCQWDLHDGGSPEAAANFGTASVQVPVPLPRPRPFDAAGAVSATPPAMEGRR
jgi:hypothetical protein